MNKNKKDNRGGARKGAGRPKTLKFKTKRYTLILNEAHVELTNEADISRNEFIRSAIQEKLERDGLLKVAVLEES